MGATMDKITDLLIPIVYPVALIWLLFEIIKSIKTKRIRENVYIALFACVLLYVVRNPNEACKLGGIIFKAVVGAATFICNLVLKILDGLNNA